VQVKVEWSLAYMETVEVSLATCPDCQGYYVVVQKAGELIDWQPRALPHVVQLDGVPEPIAADFREAQLARGYGLYKAAVMVFRRAVQATCSHLDAPDIKLEKQIDWLADNHKISEGMREAAHEVRHFGNAGAHPGADGLNDVDAEDADLAFAFTRSLLERVFTEPHRVAAARQKRLARTEGKNVAP
jgi:Domain of unknown function (DUF4145)